MLTDRKTSLEEAAAATHSPTGSDIEKQESPQQLDDLGDEKATHQHVQDAGSDTVSSPPENKVST